MIHVDEGELLAYLDEEASDTEQAHVAGHLAACASCADELRRLRDLSADVRGILAMTDAPVPVERAKIRLDAVRREQAGRRRGAVTPMPGRFAQRASRSFRRGLLQAAALALILAGVASAAIPRSPLRAWVASAIDAVFGEEAAVTSTPAVQPEPAVAPVPEAVASQTEVAPSDGRVSVVLRSPPSGTRVQVEVTDDPVAIVRAVASLRAGAGRLEAFGIAGDEILVKLPRSATVATVEVDGRVLLRTEAGSFVQLPAGVTASGDEVVLHIRP
ncbi:MAG: anti-sigma factor family protein [Longimicrobiales bacterium]